MVPLGAILVFAARVPHRHSDESSPSAAIGAAPEHFLEDTEALRRDLLLEDEDAFFGDGDENVGALDAQRHAHHHGSFAHLGSDADVGSLNSQVASSIPADRGIDSLVASADRLRASMALEDRMASEPTRLNEFVD